MQRAFALVLGITTASTTAKGVVEIVFPPYLDRHGYDLALIGLMTSLLAVMQLASRVPIGLAYRPHRSARQLAAALVVFGLSASGYAFAEGHPAAVLVLTAVHGFAFGAIGTLGLALAIDITEGRRAGPSMAWYTAAISAGYALGSVLGGTLAEVAGIARTLATVGVLPIAAALLVMALPEMRGAAPAPERAPGLGGLLRAGARLDGRVWLASMTVLYINLIWDSLDTFFVIFAPTVGISLATVGVLRAVKSGAGTLIRLFAPLVLRFVDHRRLTLAGILAATGAMIAVPASTALVPLLAAFVVLGFARGVLRTTSAATIAELRREGRDVGLASGVYNAGLDLGGVAGPVVGGAVASVIGIPQMFQALALIGLAAWLAVALSSARTREAAGLGVRNVIPFKEASEDPAPPVRASPQERSDQPRASPPGEPTAIGQGRTNEERSDE